MTPATSQNRKPRFDQVAEMAAFLRRMKKLPPARRVEALACLADPTRQIREIVVRALRQIGRVERRGCSIAVIRATTHRGDKFVCRGRARSDGKSRIGDKPGVRPTRRLVPAPAVALEDRYDLMTKFEADTCDDPPSVTGLQMTLIKLYKLRDIDEPRIKRKKSKKPRKSRKSASIGDADASLAA